MKSYPIPHWVPQIDECRVVSYCRNRASSKPWEVTVAVEKQDVLIVARPKPPLDDFAHRLMRLFIDTNWAVPCSHPCSQTILLDLNVLYRLEVSCALRRTVRVTEHDP